jgi:predicted esterase
METWHSVDVTTRAYVLVDAPPQPRATLLAFHGYAEHPRQALQAMRQAGLSQVLLAAPMGQHHFYRSDEVVASWMTRHERRDQIRQIVAFLEAIWEELARRYTELPLYCAGFSQGAATAYRAAALSRLPVRRLFVLAGEMPPEVAAALARTRPVPATLFWGEQDTRLARSVFERDSVWLKAAGWPAELRTLPGGHGWLPGVVEAIALAVANDLAAGP